MLSGVNWDTAYQVNGRVGHSEYCFLWSPLHIIQYIAVHCGNEDLVSHGLKGELLLRWTTHRFMGDQGIASIILSMGSRWESCSKCCCKTCDFIKVEFKENLLGNKIGRKEKYLNIFVHCYFSVYKLILKNKKTGWRSLLLEMVQFVSIGKGVIVVVQ